MATHTPTLHRMVDLTDLPTLPHVLARLIETLAAGDVTIAKIAGIVKLDPALCHKTITMAHQVPETAHPIVDNVDKALDIIGLDTAQAMISHAVTLQAFAANPGHSQNVPNILIESWRHAVACAHAGELIAREIAYPSPELAYVAGLIHDIGKLALLMQYPKKYPGVFPRDQESGEHGPAQEAAMGLDHARAGFQLLRRWNRHTFIADAVLYHHRKLESIEQASPLVQIVYAANLMTAVPSENRERGITAAQKLFGFSPHQTAEIQVQTKVSLQESEQFLRLDRVGREQEALDTTKKSWDRIQHGIQEAAKQSALLGNVAQYASASADTEALIRELKKAIWVMFDVRDTLLFLYEERTRTLVEQVNASPFMAAVRIPMTNKNCLPVACLLQHEILDSFTRTTDSELTILDAQLTGKLNTQGMLSVPLAFKDRPVGCILLGIDKGAFPYLSKQFKLLGTIVQPLATALYAQREKALTGDDALSEQMAALYNRCRKVVHEANNPLGVIKNYLKVLEMKMTGQNVACDEIHTISEEITRVGNILKGLTGAEVQEGKPIERVDLNHTLADMARLLGASLGNHGDIEIHLNLDDDLPKANLSKDRVKQIAINLLKNAAEAMPDGGRIDVLTHYLPATPDADPLKNSSNGSARIQFRDNGPGLPEAIRAALYEPRSSSKPDHEGLGLAVVKNLIQSLDGSIACDSGPSGTTFTIELPI